MFCIVIRGALSNDSWRIRRSVEILAYHADRQTVEILFLLCVDNLLADGQVNGLEVLHPGFTDHELLKEPWPFPWHVDEARGDPGRGPRANVLTSVYGSAIKKVEGRDRLQHVSGLTPWDSWYDDPEHRPVTIWPAEQKDVSTKDAMKRVFPSTPTDGFVPFTVFQLGPFTRHGLNLLAFRLTLSGETYRKLVEGDRVFTVDGPETLLLRISRKYIPEMQGCETWHKRLAGFQTCLNVDEGYDVILLQPADSCNRIHTVRECGIVKAPLQPQPRTAGVRYLTGNSRFCLSLAYAKNMKQAKVRQAVGLRSRV